MIVPFSTVLVLPEVLVAGFAQLGVPFGVRVTRANRMTVGLPAALVGPLNVSEQPLKFDGGAVDTLPLTATWRREDRR